VNILFVNHGDFATNSLVHIGSFANELAVRGHDCIVAVPETGESLSALPEVRFTPAVYSEVLGHKICFQDKRPCDILHAWTPRECVRRFVSQYMTLFHARLVTHLEDNESFLLEAFSGRPMAELLRLDDYAISMLLPTHLAHPRRLRNLLCLADGVTVITSKLLEFVPPGLPSAVLTPGAELFTSTLEPELRASLGVAAHEKIVMFNGRDNFATTKEIDKLYQAIKLLNDSGCPTRLIRTGDTLPAFARNRDCQHVIELGLVPRTRLPALWAIADVFVQPGAPNQFNDFRLPSKLPEYFAAGRPVVLPATNIGLQIVDGKDGVLLYKGSADEIANTCRRIFEDSLLAATLAVNARAFAKRMFNPTERTDELEALYARVLSAPPRADWRGTPVSDYADLPALLKLAARSPENQAAVVDSIADQIAAIIRLTETEEHRRAHDKTMIKALEARLATLQQELDARVDKITRVHSSFSWKATTPLRWLRRKILDRKMQSKDR